MHVLGAESLKILSTRHKTFGAYTLSYQEYDLAIGFINIPSLHHISRCNVGWINHEQPVQNVQLYIFQRTINDLRIDWAAHVLEQERIDNIVAHANQLREQDDETN